MTTPSSAEATSLARRVFLSYAHQDGRDTAERLRDLLHGIDCQVWLDTNRICGGTSWGREIEQALNDCDVLLAVLTPASYVSEICRAEEIWALDEGKTVIPVLAFAGTPVSIHLKVRQWRKYPEQQADLLNDMASVRQDLSPLNQPPHSGK